MEFNIAESVMVSRKVIIEGVLQCFCHIGGHIIPDAVSLQFFHWPFLSKVLDIS